MKSGPKNSAIVLIILELILCLIIYFVCLYIRRSRASGPDSDDSGSGLTRPGVEPILVFFPYSVLKELCHCHGLQCAVCRKDFNEGGDETLRLIPTCGHVFHSKCVHPWAVACPCCRAGPGLDGLSNGGEGEDEDVVVVVEIDEEEKMIKLPEEVREKITVDGKLVVQPRMELEPCPRTE